ncbi:MAG TPA: SURF1 family protein [Jiangellaceae bacterium]
MLDFLASRQWVVRIIAGLVLATAFVLLGLWQLDRNEQRQARNAAVEAGLNRPPAPIDDVLAAGRPVDAGDQWRTIQATGRYDGDNQLVLRLRPQGGQAGVHVLTPLVTSSGVAVLVDRGFVATSGVDVPDVPAPPPGDVEVIARVRASEDGGSRTGDPSTGMIRYVDLEVLAPAVDRPLYGGWLELVEQDPPADDSLALVPPPEIEAGPHLSYAIQWFAFTVIGIGGFVLLIRAEARVRREEASSPTNDGPVGATTAGHPK